MCSDRCFSESQTASRNPAKVLVMNPVTSTSGTERVADSVATAAEDSLTAHDPHVPDDASATRLAPDDLPSVDDRTDLYFGGDA